MRNIPQIHTIKEGLSMNASDDSFKLPLNIKEIITKRTAPPYFVNIKEAKNVPIRLSHSILQAWNQYLTRSF